MKKQFLAAFAAGALILSGCSSKDESPSELDILIEQLQTIQLTSETVPEETPDDVNVPETTEETTENVTVPENTEETTENVTVPENTEETTEDIITEESTENVTEDSTASDNTEETPENTTAPENAEETTDSSEDNNSTSVTYDSVTVKVLSIEEDNISVESEGTIYNIIIDENTGIFGGDILEGKTVTITYMITNEDSATNITAAFIMVLPDN